jgi:hypothetical protein
MHFVAAHLVLWIIVEPSASDEQLGQSRRFSFVLFERRYQGNISVIHIRNRKGFKVVHQAKDIGQN